MAGEWRQRNAVIVIVQNSAGFLFQKSVFYNLTLWKTNCIL